MPVIPELKPGDPVSAQWLNGLRALLMGQDISIDASSGLGMMGGISGKSITYTSGFEAWIKIKAGTANQYRWVEQVPQPGGTWIDGPNKDTTLADPACEATGNTGVPVDTIVWASRDKVANRVNFYARSCS